MIRRVGFDAALAGLYVLWSGNRTGFGLLVGLTLGFVVVSVYDLATAHPNHGRRALRMRGVWLNPGVMISRAICRLALTRMARKYAPNRSIRSARRPWFGCAVPRS